MLESGDPQAFLNEDDGCRQEQLAEKCNMD